MQRGWQSCAWTFVAMALGLASSAAAEPEPVPSRGMDEVVVTASSAPRDRADVTAAVSVIDGAEIEAKRYDNLPEMLRHVPGLHVEQPGSRGGRSSLYVRGLDPNQAVILVDGVPLNDPNNNLGGSFDLSTLDTDQVERIEVVRGPLSAVHGSAALAGAINVITKTGKAGDRVVLDGSGGRFGYGRGVVAVRGQRGIFDASVLTAAGTWTSS